VSDRGGVYDFLLTWYDRQGNRIGLFEYGRLCQREEYRRVAQTFVGSFRVSTIWLGVDHSFGEDAVPLIFETMIFCPTGGHIHYVRRYPTEEAALAGHDQAQAYLTEQFRAVIDSL
jgi:hypothetical protein